MNDVPTWLSRLPRWIPLCVLALAGCEGTKVRLFNPHPMNTPEWRYDEAFYGLRKKMSTFRQMQGAQLGQVEAAVADILKDLETMRELMEEPFRTQVVPLMEVLQEVKKDVERGSVSAGVFRRMQALGDDVDARFYPEKVTLKRPAAESAAAAPPAAPSAPAPASSPAPPPAVVLPPGSVPGWMVVTAWRKAHEELAAAYPERAADAAAAYGKAREALALLAKGAGEDAAAQLQIYLNEYARLAAVTGGFSQVPEGQTADGVKKALAAVARGVEAHAR